MSLFVFAVGDNGYLLIGAIVVLILGGISFGYYSRSGSDINQRPHDGRGGDTGAKGHSSLSTTDDEVERTIGTHGTR